MITIEDLAEHLGFADLPTDTEAMQRCLDSAIALLDPHIVIESFQDHPTYELSLLTIAADFWRIKDAPRGSYMFGNGAEIPIMNNPRNTLPVVWPWLANAGLVNAVVVA